MAIAPNGDLGCRPVRGYRLLAPLYFYREADTLRGNVSAAWNESAVKTAMQRPGSGCEACFKL